MKTVGNILWLVFGGGILAVLWALVGTICCLTIILFPIGIQCYKFAAFVIWPFNRTIAFSNSAGKVFLNAIWIVVFGWELAVISCCVGLIWCITIAGIPFGRQCFKFAELALAPFGSQIV